MDRASQFAVVAAAAEAQADSGIDRGRAGPAPDRRHASAAPSAATMGLEQRVRASSATAGALDLVDHELRRPAPVRLLRPQLVRQGGRLDGRAQGPATVISTGCTSGLDAVGYGDQLIRRAAPTSWSPARPTRRSPRSPWPASTRSGRHRRATTTPSTRRGRSTATATASCSARAPRCSSWRSSSAPGGAARTSYARSPGYATRSNAFHMTGLQAGRPGDGRRRSGVALGRGRRRPDGDRLHQRARLRHQAERPARDGGVQAQPRRRTPIGHRSAPSSRWSATRSAPSASIEIAACALAIEHNVVPPTANLRRPAIRSATWTTCRSSPASTPADAVLTVGSGFGGFQSAMILRRAT